MHLRYSDRQLPNSIVLYEATSGDGPGDLFSCVAVHDFDPQRGWPALGGTRWVHVDLPPGTSVEKARGRGRREAMRLAQAMTWKNRLLRHASAALSREQADEAGGRDRTIGWQGGKGVIVTVGSGAAPSTLDPLRLVAHGRLIEHIGGDCFGSKDAGVGTAELKWIETATRYTIGLGCQLDTGEATAYGVLGGIAAAGRSLGLPVEQRTPEQLVTEPRSSDLGGLRVLVVGCGKVGLPLLELLDRRGAECVCVDPLFSAGPQAVYEQAANRGGAVSEQHRALVARLSAEGRCLTTLDEALEQGVYDIVSPNGGPTHWLLSGPDQREATVAERLARWWGDVGRGSHLIVAGAGNAQLPTGDDEAQDARSARAILDDAGVVVVPDPVVSPGGVIAVSHELRPSWDATAVNTDAAAIVHRSVEELFARTRQVSTAGFATTLDMLVERGFQTRP